MKGSELRIDEIKGLIDRCLSCGAAYGMQGQDVTLGRELLMTPLIRNQLRTLLTRRSDDSDHQASFMATVRVDLTKPPR